MKGEKKSFKGQEVIYALNTLNAAAAKSVGDGKYHDEVKQCASLLAEFVVSTLEQQNDEDQKPKKKFRLKGK